jgi:translation initiation factor 2 gamma subunit (eIF-2gamma)
MNQRVLNINMGIIGHVDSGKTSLAKVLSGEDGRVSEKPSLLTQSSLRPGLDSVV